MGIFYQELKTEKREKKGILHLGGEKEIGDIDYKPSPLDTIQETAYMKVDLGRDTEGLKASEQMV